MEINGCEPAGRILEETVPLFAGVSREGFWAWERETGEFTVNHAFLGMLGYTLEDFNGDISFLDDLCHPEDRSLLRRQLNLLSPYDAGACELEYRLRRRDGKWAWVSARVRAIPGDEPGTIKCVVGAQLEVTASKKFEETARAEEKRFREAMDAARMGLWEWDIPSGKVTLDSSGMAVVDYTVGTQPPCPSTWEGLLHPEDISRVAAGLAANLLGSREAGVVECRIIGRSGAIRWVKWQGGVVETDAEGTPTRVLGTIHDITGRKIQEEALRASEERFRSAIGALHDGVIVQDRSGEILFCNRRATEMLGVSTEKRSKRGPHHPLWEGVHEDGSAWPTEAHPSVAVLREGQEIRDVLMGVRREDGSLGWINANSSPLFRTGESEPYAAVTTFTDVTERHRFEAERERLMWEALDRAEKDPLTNLLNHRTFYHQLAVKARDVQVNGACLAVIVMDLDNFKNFNDTYGHLVGDDVLLAVSDALRGVTRSEDLVARIGGDEFALALPRTNRAEAEEWARRLRGIAQTMVCISTAGESLPLRLSMGVAIFPEEADAIKHAVHMADRRVIEDKTVGPLNERPLALRQSLGEAGGGFPMLDAMVAAVDNMDRYTRRHSEDVMALCGILGRELNMSPEEIQSLEVAALIHDVGKIGVPASILRRPGQLSASEMAKVRQHPVLGAVLVEAVPELGHTRDAVRHHHEAWDGSGYPDGLRGESIPYSARVMAVADAFSALTMDRPYRIGNPVSHALDILQAGAGKQWDPECVTAFVRACESLHDQRHEELFRAHTNRHIFSIKERVAPHEMLTRPRQGHHVTTT